MGSHKNKFQEFYHNLAKPDCGYVDFPKEGDNAKYDVDNIRWSIWNSRVMGKLQPKTLLNLPNHAPGERRGNILPNKHGGITSKSHDRPGTNRPCKNVSAWDISNIRNDKRRGNEGPMGGEMPIMMPHSPTNPKAGFGEMLDQMQNPSKPPNKTLNTRTSILQTKPARNSIYYNSYLGNDHCQSPTPSSDSDHAPAPTPKHRPGVIQVGRRDSNPVPQPSYQDQLKKVDAILKKPGNFNSLMKKHDTPTANAMRRQIG